MRVRISVIADLMPGIKLSSDYSEVFPAVFSNDKKRCLYPVPVKHIKDLRSIAPVRTVVKGQCYLHLVVSDAPYRFHDLLILGSRHPHYRHQRKERNQRKTKNLP